MTKADEKTPREILWWTIDDLNDWEVQQAHEFDNGDQFVLKSAYDSLLAENERLRKELEVANEIKIKMIDLSFDRLLTIKSLEAKTTKLVEALKFYGNKENWLPADAYRENTRIVDADSSNDRGDYFYGGKTARQALAEFEKES